MNNQSSTNISCTVNKVFREYSCYKMAECKPEWIKMPKHQEELQNITKDFEI